MYEIETLDKDIKNERFRISDENIQCFTKQNIKIYCHKYICLVILCLGLKIFENNNCIWISKLGSVALMKGYSFRVHCIHG